MFTHNLASEITQVGSRVTCNPAPTDTDDDYLAYVHSSNWIAFDASMNDNGFSVGGSRPEHADADYLDNGFCSYTKGEINVIATANHEFVKKFMAATSVAKRLNLLNKEDRIALFQAVLYANPCHD